MKIAIIGPYPKPYGGISVHVRNFLLYCRRNFPKNLKLVIYNTSFSKVQVDNYPNIIKMPSFPFKLNLIGRSVWLLRVLIHQKPNIIHYQASISWYWRILIIFLARFLHAKSILSVHGAGIKKNIFSNKPIMKFSFIERAIWAFIKKYDSIICDNSYQIKNLKSLGYDPQKIFIVSEFIPSTVKKEDYDQIPKKIFNFYDEHKISLYGMGWNAYRGNVDLYGIDMMIKLMQKINEVFSHHEVGLTLKLIKVDNSYLKKLRNEITKLGLIDIQIINQDLKEIYPLIEKADIMIRPTFTDGDSVSIREALYFNTDVITSDAISRPKECIIFENRNQTDFENKVMSLIEKKFKENQAKKKSTIKKETSADKIIEVYSKLLKRNES